MDRIPGKGDPSRHWIGTQRPFYKKNALNYLAVLLKMVSTTSKAKTWLHSYRSKSPFCSQVIHGPSFACRQIAHLSLLIEMIPRFDVISRMQRESNAQNAFRLIRKWEYKPNLSRAKGTELISNVQTTSLCFIVGALIESS